MKYLIPIFCLLSACVPILIPPTQPPLSKIWINEELSSENESVASELGFPKGFVFYQNVLDVRDDGTFDGIENPLFQSIVSQIPNDFAGPVVLDWEGVSLDRLWNESIVREQFLIPLRWLKDKFPLAKIGYYNLPQTPYYGRELESWNSKQQIIEKILNESTGWFPSLYDYYHDNQNGDPGHIQRDSEYFKWNIDAIQNLNKKKLPTFVYIWHRFHPCCSERKMEYIGDAEFIRNITDIFSVSESNSKVNGIIWWGADLYDLRQNESSTQAIYTRECGTDKAKWPACLNTLHRKILNLLKEIP